MSYSSLCGFCPVAPQGFSVGMQFCWLLSVILPIREGAFSANFTPEILDRFRELCKKQSKSYSKVLERLAEIYLETNGEVLNYPSVPATPKQLKSASESIEPVLLQELQNRMEQLEGDYKNADDRLEDLIEGIEKRLGGVRKLNFPCLANLLIFNFNICYYLLIC